MVNLASMMISWVEVEASADAVPLTVEGRLGALVFLGGNWPLRGAFWPPGRRCAARVKRNYEYPVRPDKRGPANANRRGVSRADRTMVRRGSKSRRWFPAGGDGALNERRYE